MKVKELIEQLQQLPPEYEVFVEGGNHRHDWREVDNVSVSHHSTWGTPQGVYLNDPDY